MLKMNDNPIIAAELHAQRLPLTQIPMIDISPMRTGVGKKQLAHDIHHALSNIGFMYIKGHGVSPQLVNEAYRVAAEFFALPEDRKKELHIRKSGVALHGYTPFFEENNDPTRSRDYKEIFDLGRLAADNKTRPFFGPTPWPEELPEFREVMEGYHLEMLGLAHLLMAALALSLDLPEGYFGPMMHEPIGIQRVLHYPSQESVEDESIIGIGAHTDYGCLTILSQDQVGGLQVQNRDGLWIDAPPIEDTFIVNIGDMMQRLTNDVYLANVHRVINASGRKRYSIPCFFDVDFDTVFSPLKSLVSNENPSKYDPIVCGQHKWKRYVDAYPYLQEANNT